MIILRPYFCLQTAKSYSKVPNKRACSFINFRKFCPCLGLIRDCSFILFMYFCPCLVYQNLLNFFFQKFFAHFLHFFGKFFHRLYSIYGIIQLLFQKIGHDSFIMSYSFISDCSFICYQKILPMSCLLETARLFGTLE